VIDGSLNGSFYIAEGVSTREIQVIIKEHVVTSFKIIFFEGLTIATRASPSPPPVWKADM
jgi:hypothetical protein